MPPEPNLIFYKYYHICGKKAITAYFLAESYENPNSRRELYFLQHYLTPYMILLPNYYPFIKGKSLYFGQADIGGFFALTFYSKLI